MSRRSGMPGPFRRLRRQPLQLVAIGLLGATVLAAASVQSVAAAVLQQTVSANWRGAYDILVTPKDALQPIEGMLPPNTLSSTASGMSLADLAHVRAVDGVDVAAPIGEILVPGMRMTSTRLFIPRDAVPAARTEPQAFRVTETYSTDDGLGERITDVHRYAVVIDQATPRPSAPDDPEFCVKGNRSSYNGYTVIYGKYPALARQICEGAVDGVNPWTVMDLDAKPDEAGGGSGDYDVSGAYLDVRYGDRSASTVARITLVDPVAEQKLLGDRGAFLDPLIAAHPSGAEGTAAIAAWASGAAGPFAEKARTDLAKQAPTLGDTPEVLADLRRLYADNGADYDAWLKKNSNAVAVAPLLVSQQPVAQLSLKLDVESLGAAHATVTEGGGPQSYTLPDGAADPSRPGQHVGSAVSDVSSLTNPFLGSSPVLDWPGTHAVVAQGDPTYDSLNIMGTARPVASAYSTTAAGIVLTASGYRSPILRVGDEAFSAGGEPTAIGEEALYAGVQRAWVPHDGDRSVLSMPVGSFDPNSVTDVDAASFVPLGAYGDVNSTLATGPHAGATIKPSATGLGLVSSRTVAVAAIQSAALWHDQTPINAIRVRVAGIDGYSPQSQDKVLRVAEAIQKLGFAVSVVAGSSPAPVAVHVTGYAFGTDDPNGKQTVGPLGTVEQKWSELGAASRVNLSLSSATYAVLGIGLAAAILLLAAAKFAGIPARREQAATMREVGFTRVRMARWYAGEELPGLVVVIAFGTLAVFLSQGSPVTLIAAGAGTAAILVASVVAVAAGAQARRLQRPRDPRSRRLGARSARGFGARQTLVHPLSTVMHIAAILVVGLAAAGLAAAIQTSIADAGKSSLAALTVGRMLLPEVVLGTVGIAGGLLLVLLVRRIDLARRSDQWATLRACGWTARQLSRAQRAEGIAILVPALILTAAAAWGCALLLGATTWRFVSIAVAAGLIASLVAYSARRKGAIA